MDLEPPSLLTVGELTDTFMNNSLFNVNYNQMENLLKKESEAETRLESLCWKSFLHPRPWVFISRLHLYEMYLSEGIDGLAMFLNLFQISF